MQSDAEISPGGFPYLAETAIASLAIAALAFGVWNARHNVPAVVMQASLPTQPFPSRRLIGITRFAVDTVTYGVRGTQALANSAHAYAVPRGEPIVIGGWAVDDLARRAAAGVAFEVDGKQRTIAEYGGSRPDVAEAFHEPALENSSYSVTIAPQALPAGVHRLAIDVESADRSGFYRVDNAATIVVGR